MSEIQIQHSSGTGFGIDESGDQIYLEHSNGSIIEINQAGLYTHINGDISLNASGNIQITGSKIELN